MADGQFPPVFHNWSKWPLDNFLPFSKIGQSGLWRISSHFLKLVEIAYLKKKFGDSISKLSVKWLSDENRVDRPMDEWEKQENLPNA